MASPIRTARALLGASHPGPTAAVTAITVLLGVASGLDPVRIVTLGVAMALGQLSVGLSNDWIDADRDRAVGRQDKPVARGDISRSLARTAAFATAAGALLVTIPLGGLALICHIVVITSAWAYNVNLKRTALSVLPYIVSFGLLPAFVTLARAEPRFPSGWIVAAGTLLGVAAHFANVLPDLDDDTATGVRGLPHRMGARASLIGTWAALLAAAICLAMIVGQPGAIGVAAAVIIGTVGLVIGWRRTGRLLFVLVIIAALVDVALLLVAGTRILG